jgi:hypothetical protein
MNNLEKIAMLIDADNTQLAKLADVVREVSTYGRIVVKRAYGNWKKGNLKNWENELNRLAIKAEQQFDYVSGKNATDMALVIDAVNLLHRGLYDAFVIVASDSDYTPLAIHLRESGVFVMGVGERKTSESFRNSCDEFVFLENISDEMTDGIATDVKEQPTKKPKRKQESRGYFIDFDTDNVEDNQAQSDYTDGIEDIREIHHLLRVAFEKYQDDDGYVNVSSAGTFIKRVKPDFDAKNFGYKKLPHLIEAFPDKYEMTKYPGKGKVMILAYRCKGED